MHWFQLIPCQGGVAPKRHLEHSRLAGVLPPTATRRPWIRSSEPHHRPLGAAVASRDLDARGGSALRWG